MKVLGVVVAVVVAFVVGVFVPTGLGDPSRIPSGGGANAVAGATGSTSPEPVTIPTADPTAGTAPPADPSAAPDPTALITPPPAPPSAIPGEPSLITGGCILRFDDDKGRPRIHENPTHKCIGARGVSVDDRGRVVLDLTTAKPIVTIQTSPDETLVGREVSAGGSGGIGSITLTLHSLRLGRNLDLTTDADREIVQGEFSNLWVSWIQSDE